MDPPALIRVCVAGITGWTGGAIAKAIRNAEDLELVAGVSRSDPDSYPSVAEALDAVRADVLVDFTHASAVKANVFSALGRGVNVVIGSSGLSASDYDSIDATARDRGVGVISAGNFSLTAAILLRAATEAARHLEAWEILDFASAGKPDAPSGTAQELAERLGDVRFPTIGVPVAGTLLAIRSVVGRTGLTRGLDRLLG
jgi:4-hydroxy-tetrahydrodipicolinate reductase